MKKAMFIIIPVLCLLFAVSFFAFALGTQRKMAVKAEGTALWDYLKQADYAKKWSMWPGKSALYPGKEPHGALLTTYVNKTALAAIKEKKGMLPDGSIIVKENYTAKKKLAALTVMYKVKGYNPQAGDWFWVKYLPDGKIAAEGKVRGCIQCHASVKANDYVATGPLK